MKKQHKFEKTVAWKNIGENENVQPLKKKVCKFGKKITVPKKSLILNTSPIYQNTSTNLNKLVNFKIVATFFKKYTNFKEKVTEI